ncbi:heavy-metal-associated domain-containing protein [Streptomyces sp. NPDC008086]|uniref:heavy-metal-associated domain-containing protein n=1 Tax=Streptomyces sp. NPDC008086 TaxID=3364807 RepID=UPI0036E611C5
MAEKTYTVSGMSCGHCAESITEEVVEVAGRTGVDVDVPAGRVTVTGEALGDAAVRAAIVEEGFEVTGAASAMPA